MGACFIATHVVAQANQVSEIRTSYSCLIEPGQSEIITAAVASECQSQQLCYTRRAVVRCLVRAPRRTFHLPGRGSLSKLLAHPEIENRLAALAEGSSETCSLSTLTHICMPGSQVVHLGPGLPRAWTSSSWSPSTWSGGVLDDTTESL